MAEKIWGHQETLDAIASKTVATTQDSYRVRIMRRRAPHLSPEMVATFDNVSQQQIFGPETWLPRLGGGGIYEMGVYHMTDTSSQIGGHVKATFGSPPTEVQPEAVLTADWKGPKDLVFPQIRPPSQGITTTTGYGPPPPLNTQTVGGASVPALAPALASALPSERLEAQRLSAVSDNLLRQENDLRERGFDLKMERMKAELMAAQKPNGSGVMEIVAALSPLVLQFMDARAKADERAAVAQQAANDRFMAMMSHKPERDPLLDKLLDKSLNAPQKDELQSIKAATEMMGSMATMTMQVLQSNAELLQASSPQESPGFKLARQAIVALQGILGNVPSVKMNAPEDIPAEGAEGEKKALPEGEQRVKLNRTEALKNAIFNLDPIEKVTVRFLKAYKAKSFQRLANHYGGNLLSLLEGELGEWASEEPEHMTYLQKLIPALFEAGTKAGYLTPTPPAQQQQQAPPAQEQAPQEPKVETPFKGKKRKEAPASAPVPTPEKVEAPAPVPVA